ncbi:hypothetical protein GCM10007424_27880 [Flavobacterium suaedae]|uniref:Lipoprotein n=1 Tax=Flavobacterium suaedae TaxID=1767027 RepID=A0ABQ1K4G2_9FLAO|nr:hypothetical protein [Flavobacterium suaedae]GGB86242.1 hypothetical protein GCM10007424_27880 [Flavobacterium suaedae]
MRTILILVSLMCLQSCCSVKRGLKENSDYKLITIALEKYFKREQYCILKKPDNSMTDYYYGGFTAKDVLLDYRFTYKGTGREEWKKEAFLEGDIKDKVLIIDDFSKIPKVNSDKEAKEYMSISRPMYSQDGIYAVIVINSFFNIELSPVTGYGFVFKKEKGKWKLYLEYVPYVS